MYRKVLPFLFALIIFNCSNDDDGDTADNTVSEVSSNSTIIAVDMSLQEVLDSGAIVVNVNNTHFAIGYRQVTANNQDPVLMRFDNGELTWARDDYETNTSDGTGRGIIYDPTNNRLHVVFTSTGIEGSSDTDYRRFTQDGWLSSYGFGGGARVVVLAQINPADGEPLNGTYVISRLSNMQSNTLNATGLSYSSNSITLEASSSFSPLKVDQSTFTCEGNSPFDYSISFNLDLTEALTATAENCE